MHATSLTSELAGEELLDATLRPIHNAWIAEARGLLGPALEPSVDFWTRWSAVRYLSDDFNDRLQGERAFVEELRPFLRRDAAEQLLQGGDRIFRSRLELDRIGRRRSTAAEVATATRDLLTQLGVWCAKIELAAAGLTRDGLRAEGVALLAHLEAGLPASA
jgi:hypothetical protein